MIHRYSSRRSPLKDLVNESVCFFLKYVIQETRK